jgi:hypothetical protein
VKTTRNFRGHRCGGLFLKILGPLFFIYRSTGEKLEDRPVSRLRMTQRPTKSRKC